MSYFFWLGEDALDEAPRLTPEIAKRAVANPYRFQTVSSGRDSFVMWENTPIRPHRD